MKPPLDPRDFILEGVMTTLRPPEPPQGGTTSVVPLDAARLNLAPMGPVVNPEFTRFILRPFKTSTTYQNLKATGDGVFHIPDDALLIARAAVRAVAPTDGLAFIPAKVVRGLVLANACRYYELKVVELDDAQERTTIVAQTVASGTLRDFLGFNRARHAVLEAAILATRLKLTGAPVVLSEYAKLQVIVDKTGAEAEHQAMAELTRFVQAFKA
ncbi:MAG: DUF447 family protein [Planctomycetota bacterium]|nr:DUF447 family protein [Planctomycetota bacterium]